MSFQDDHRIIYVIAFAPDFTGWHGDNVRVGGLEWRTSWDDAVEELKLQLEDGETDHDYVLRTIPVPISWLDDEITSWLSGEGRELIDVPIPKEWVYA